MQRLHATAALFLVWGGLLVPRFATAQTLSFAAKKDAVTGANPRAIAVADFNGDGKLDFVTADYDFSKVSVLLGNGDGTFAAKVDYATGMAPYGVAVSDFNGDGKPDIVVANAFANTVSVLLNNGDGTLAAKVDYSTGAGTTPETVAVGDFNGDGKLTS